MTEKEAIETLKHINLSRVHPFYSWEEMAEVRDIAIKALEEIQEYRALGTVEQIEEQMLLTAADETILREYKVLGVVEELREAKEKLMPKTPCIWGDGYSDGYPVYDMYECPGCGEEYEIDGEKYDFCPNCGQAIDWNLIEELKNI